MLDMQFLYSQLDVFITINSAVVGEEENLASITTSKTYQRLTYNETYLQENLKSDKDLPIFFRINPALFSFEASLELEQNRGLLFSISEVSRIAQRIH